MFIMPLGHRILNKVRVCNRSKKNIVRYTYSLQFEHWSTCRLTDLHRRTRFNNFHSTPVVGIARPQKKYFFPDTLVLEIIFKPYTVKPPTLCCTISQPYTITTVLYLFIVHIFTLTEERFFIKYLVLSCPFCPVPFVGGVSVRHDNANMRFSSRFIAAGSKAVGLKSSINSPSDFRFLHTHIDTGVNVLHKYRINYISLVSFVTLVDFLFLFFGFSNACFMRDCSNVLTISIQLMFYVV